MFRTSDSHAALRYAPNYVRLISHRVRQLRKVYGEDLRVLVINDGDATGVNRDSVFDRGALTYRMYAILSLLYNVQVVEGNHGGLDWVGSQFETGKPNSFHYDQVRTFLDEVQELHRIEKNTAERSRVVAPEGILVANAVPTETGKKIYRKHQDLKMASGGTMRTIGFVTPVLVLDSSYDPKSSFQLFELSKENGYRLEDIERSAYRELLRAAEDQVDLVILEFHEKYSDVVELMKKIYRWKNRMGRRRPNLARLRIVYPGSGHDHRQGQEPIRNPRWSEKYPGFIPGFYGIGSGDSFSTTEILFNRKGRIKVGSVQHYPNSDQAQFEGADSLLHPLEQDIIAMIQEELDQVSPLMDVTLGQIPRIPEDKQTLKDAHKRTTLGTLVATSLLLMGRQLVQEKESDTEVRADRYLGFQNTNAIRITTLNNQGLPKGAFTYGDLFDMFPFDFEFGAVRLPGRLVQVMHDGIRAHMANPERKGIYSPQMSINGRLDEMGKIQLVNAAGDWESLDPDQGHWLMLDDFTYKGLLHAPECREVRKYLAAHPENIIEHERITRDQHKRFLPPLLSRYDECSSSLLVPNHISTLLQSQ